METKDKRIASEMERLAELYKDMEPTKKAIAVGLLGRAAFMRVECEDLEAYLAENGWTEQFQQTPSCPPYDRARPQGQAYQTLNKNYQSIIKQLDAMLPVKAAVQEDDPFDEFVVGRDDG